MLRIKEHADANETSHNTSNQEVDQSQSVVKKVGRTKGKEFAVRQRAGKKEICVLDGDILRQDGVCQFISRVLKNRFILSGRAKNHEEYTILLKKNPLDIAIVISPDNLYWLYSAIDITTQLSPRTKLIGVVNHIPDSQLKNVGRLDIKGIVNSVSGLQGILDAIESIEQGRDYMDESIFTAKKVKYMLKQPNITLTEREKEILPPLAKGWKNQEIAEYFSLETNTIKSHLRSIYGKFLVKTRQEAIHYALTNGFITLGDDNQK